MKNSDSNQSQYRSNANGEFVITDYNNAKPFSSFFPGIAGTDGIPMWVFYVNRGQCISGMGVQDKDHAIMEFLPANRAYNLVSTHGFRTFLKYPHNSVPEFYEPFQSNYRDRGLDRIQRMIISPSQLTLEEINHSLLLKITVDYFTVPQDTYAGCIRTLRISNFGNKPVSLEGLDGLPVIVPYGVDNFCLKNMRRTIEAFVEVKNHENRVPFFKGKVEPADRPDVVALSKGNFYLGFEGNGTETNILTSIVDPAKVFGRQLDYSYPQGFLENSIDDIDRDQKLENQFPCAMGMFRTVIEPDRNFVCHSIIGHASSVQELNGLIPEIARTQYIDEKRKTNNEIIDTLTQHNFICSNEPVLDNYTRQNFLDNTLRGGFAHTIKGGPSPKTFYVFSRKHGDMERDYNDFRLMPTRYSQGNGNFRDINQNRRSDLFFNPDIRESNVEHFYNLIQLDGYNPLVLKEILYAVEDLPGLSKAVKDYVQPEQLPGVLEFCKELFTPGSLLAYCKEQGSTLATASGEFLGAILDYCKAIPTSDHGEGYWVDHWTYNLDLLENFAAVYPEELGNLLFTKNTFTFHDSPYAVMPRKEKCVLWNETAMQLGAVRLDEEKELLIESRECDRNLVHTKSGTGEVFHTTLFAKLLCLAVNKLATLDPEGVGVEMEAGKPGWYDALNGLPGLFGSSTCETLELKRHILFLQQAIHEYHTNDEEVMMYEELEEFTNTVHDLLDQNPPAFAFWEAASSAKEVYREKTRLGISGIEKTVTLNRINTFLDAALLKLNAGIEKAKDKTSGTLFTYFCYEVTDYLKREAPDRHGNKQTKRNADGLECIRPLQFKQVPLPLFLEGPVHYLRCLPDKDEASTFAESVKRSDLFDKSLRMYKVNASLNDQPMEIGRARVFSPGWLENESIWLHMEYKYMLELLRNELFEKFYEDFRHVFIPFLSPHMYGRSIFENSSFLVSSANTDSSLHGNGFVARLTGATAEYIHILLIMVAGQKPFYINSNKELELRLNPSLPGWLFTKEARTVKLNRNGRWQEIELPANTFSFMFLGSILVTYHNRGRKDTYGGNGAKPHELIVIDSEGQSLTISGDTISGEMAVNIRDRKVDTIDIMLR